MYYGGAPAGPAGTGKTETVKDMGRTLGIFVVVTNCSGEHRYKDMAKIFKGICQSGLWGCFDEFNRIDLEVLSVVAMQVESITAAKKAHADMFKFPDEQYKIKLVQTCGYFITMNPGYAGRQELPENLKVLFRGVTMMVPNREIIMQVKLASCGYKRFELLAAKFNILYALCEQQLSKQKHYDFGLRNILSVLRTAGKTLRDDDGKPDDEPRLMMRTLKDMNLSKLVAQDVPLFIDLLGDTFPDEVADTKKYEVVEAAIRRHVDLNELIHHKSWVLKIVQIHESNLVRHGNMLIGPVGAGKSTCLSILGDALSDVLGVKHIMHKLNPKSFTSKEMYGVKNFSGEWTKGIFSELWRKVNKKENKNINWIVCDGPVDAIWIENLNTVLDDNKVLTLANGDRLFMRESCKLWFEVENLNNASPATVSRCGQIFISHTDLGYEPIIMGWVKQRTKDDKTTTNEAEDGISSLKPTIDKLFTKEMSETVAKILNRYFVDLRLIELVSKKNAANPIMEL
jgi:dynein heavy chain, axonemal